MEHRKLVQNSSKLGNTKQFALALSLACSGIAHSAPIQIEHDFETRSNDLGSQWTEIENDSNDVATYNGALRLRDNAAGTVSAAAISNYHYDNTTSYLVSFSWRATQNTESSDTLYFGLYDENLWQPLWTASLGGSSWQREDINLEAGLGMEGQFGFWTEVSASTETAYVDYLYIQPSIPTQDNITTVETNPVSVNEPTPLLLALIGMAAVALRRSAISK